MRARAAATAHAVLLDNEALQALSDLRHRKHRAALAVLAAIDVRTRARAGTVAVLTTTATRIEAGTPASAADRAALGRLPLLDMELTSGRADRGTELRRATGCSVVDATLAQAAEELAGPRTSVVLLTSDTSDLAALRAHAPRPAGISIAWL